MNKKTYYLSLETIVPNAFIELLKRNIQTTNIPLIIIEKYANEVAKELKRNNNNIKYGLSRNNTNSFSINYSKYFTINDLNKPTTISLNKEITKEKLIDHFTGYLPLELLLAFQNETVVTLGLLNNLNQEIKNPKIKKRTQTMK